MPEQDETMDKLMDHADMFVLDLSPNLKTLCLLKVIELSNKIDYRHELPRDLVMDINNMSNIIEENFQCSCASAYLSPESNLFLLSKLTRTKRIFPYYLIRF